MIDCTNNGVNRVPGKRDDSEHARHARSCIPDLLLPHSVFPLKYQEFTHAKQVVPYGKKVSLKIWFNNTKI